MSRNTFGRLFAVTTFGESHGPAIGCVIDGCPPGLAIEIADFRDDLERRATGRSRHTSQRRETDEVEILSGVYDGQTTGTPIALLIRNTDAKPRDYDRIVDQFRPGHADYSYWRKYGIRDPRGGGRSSARETTMRVAAAVIARKWLQQHYGVAIAAYVAQVGPIHAENVDAAFAADNAIGWPDPDSFAQVENFLDSLRRSGDSVGSRIDVTARGVPVGWGEPVYGKLDAELAAALMSINAVKGVEIGAGFAAVEQLGTEHRGEFHADGFVGNEAGGILGGIATGQDITARVAFKPASSLRLPVPSIDQAGEAVEVVTTGRHDPCVGLRAPVIVEAMVALVLIDQALRHRAQCGDVRHQQPPIPPSRSAGGAGT